MDTRSKIKDQARVLFNEKGIASVSLREISHELGISHGNLRYHFPGKGPLVRELLDDCLNSNTEFIEELLITDFSLENIVKLNWKSAYKAWEYRFLVRDISHSANSFPEVAALLKENYELRKKEFRVLFNLMQQRSMLKAELYPGHLDHLIDQIMVHIEFGFANIDLYYKGVPEEMIRQFHYRVFILILPMMLSPYDQELIELLQL